MLRLLETELKEIGATEVTLTGYGAVLATIPATAEGPTIGLLAHVDTAPQFNATGVKPRVIKGYNGGAITYPDNDELVLTPEAFPYLGEKLGNDIITASGLTLLGADDKAGVAIVMTAVRHLLAHPEIPHGPIRVGFTPDEEIGRGVDDSLPKDLACDFAYTFDGSRLGEIEYESFSADFAEVTVKGVSIHPGWAKDKLVNAIHLAAKIVDTLPHVTMTPETTEGREGFIHAVDMSGGSSEMKIRFILRDFERDGLEAKGESPASGLRSRRRHRAARRDQLRHPPAIPQHALLAGKRHDAGRTCPRCDTRDRARTGLRADPRRHRRLASDRKGCADAQPVYRHAEHPRAA